MFINTALPEPPNVNSVGVMTHIDHMPPEWRALVHEYGAVIVSRIMAEASSLEEAREMLAYWRSQRQAEWLATNYVSARLFKKAA